MDEAVITLEAEQPALIPDAPPEKPKRVRRSAAQLAAAGVETIKSKTVASAPPKGWTSDEHGTISIAVGMAVLIGSSALSQVIVGDGEHGMTQEEADQLSAPLTRILLRHMAVRKGNQGDVADGFAAAIIMLAYSMRLMQAKSDRARERARTAKAGLNPEGPNVAIF